MITHALVRRVLPRGAIDGSEAEEEEDEEDDHRRGLSERSQAVGAVLSLLLVALTACLLGLLLYKKERR